MNDGDFLFFLHHLYRNNLKNREFYKEAPQNFCLEQATIAERQGASENKNSEVSRRRKNPILQVVSVYIIISFLPFP